MAIDTRISCSRRALLAGGIGGVAALLASALGRPLPARAGSDGDVVLGAANTAGTTTAISNFTTTQTALAANCSNGHAVSGTSSAEARAGVSGVSNVPDGFAILGSNAAAQTTGYLAGSHGVRGWSSGSAGTVGHSASSTGVLGYSGTGDLPAAPGDTGVYGYASDTETSSGVLGRSTMGLGVRGIASSGDGVFGQSDSGVGVYGFAPSTRGVYGNSYTGDGVFGSSGSGNAVLGISGKGVAISASSASGWGVYAATDATDKPAVTGRSSTCTAVLGHSGSGPQPTVPAKTGVHGYAAHDSSSRGVHGRTAAGRGVYGQATTGVGMYGYATSGTAVHAATSDPLKGYAIRAVGRVKLDNCAGVATVAAGTKSVVVTPGIDLTTSSAVVATLLGTAGGTTTVHRCVVDGAADSFTIHLTSNSTTNARVAWHVFG